jgi:hypothetical protein
MIERPSKHEIELGRLTKKMNRVKDQRDKARHELAQYKTVMQDMPNLQRRYDEYQKWKKEQETMRSLMTRVNEQSLLIKKLTGEV